MRDSDQRSHLRVLRHHVDVDAVRLEDGVAGRPDGGDDHALVSARTRSPASPRRSRDLEEMPKLDLAGHGQRVDIAAMMSSTSPSRPDMSSGRCQR